MIIIHNYSPRYTKKLIDMGIARKGDGFKLTQHYRTPEEMRFNQVGREDGELYEIVRDYASCFYIDRLQGGTFFSTYSYDKALLDAYDRLTGGNFLGFQLHELGHTRALDWKRIQKQLEACGLEWSEENIYESVKKISENKDFPHFSQGSAGEYADLTPPETLSEYVEDISRVIKDRQMKTGGKVLNCDSNKMYCGLEREHNIEVSFIEIGAQCPFTRTQFAMRRGISRANGKKWGTYLEPWKSTSSCTAYCFMADGRNEWFIEHNANFSNQTAGEKGGSSMSLARRMMFYSLFAGADYFSEEWGMSNTFCEWENFTLSPYGQIKKDMADFSRNFSDVKPYVPVAIVIPEEYRYLSIRGKEVPYPNDIVAGEYDELKNRIHSLYYNDSVLGDEDMIFTTGRYGSIFDIIYENSYSHPEEEYELLVDFSGQFAGRIPCAVDGYDEQATIRVLDRFVEERLPFTFTCTDDVDYMLFENEGRQYGCFLNHNGVSKNPETGEWVNAEATVEISLQLKVGKIQKVWDICGCEYTVDGGSLQAVLGGGEFILFQM